MTDGISGSLKMLIENVSGQQAVNNNSLLKKLMENKEKTVDMPEFVLYNSLL